MPDANCGRMIIELIDNGTSLPVPHVTFDPPGRFTERLMEHYLSHFAQEIQRAQSKVRFAQTHSHERGTPQDNEPVMPATETI